MHHEIYQSVGGQAPEESKQANVLISAIEEQRRLNRGAGNWMWASVLVTLLGVSVMFAGIYQNEVDQKQLEVQVAQLSAKNSEQQQALADLAHAKEQLLENQKSSIEQVALTKTQLSLAQQEVKQTQLQLAQQEEQILRAQAQITAAQMTLYGNQNSLAISESLLVRKINSLNAQTQDAMTAMQTQSQAQAQQEQVPSTTDASVGDSVPLTTSTGANSQLASSGGARRALPVSDDPPQGASVRPFHGGNSQSGDDPNVPQDPHNTAIP